MFYTLILGNLRNVMDDGGNHISNSFRHEGFNIYLGYQPRDRDFAHNYERNKYLKHRDRYVYVSGRMGNIHILTERQKNHIFIYEKNMRKVFGDDTDKAIKVLSTLMRKFYDRVDIEERSRASEYDISTNRYQELERFNEVL